MHRQVLFVLSFSTSAALRLSISSNIYEVTNIVNKDGINHLFDAFSHNREALESTMMLPEDAYEQLATISAPRYNHTSYFPGHLSSFALAQPKSILFFGSSVDRYALDSACVSGGTQSEHPNQRGPSNNYCKVGDWSLLFLLNPGSGDRPFWAQDSVIANGYPVQSDAAMFEYGHAFIKSKNVAEPDLIVVDSSLWDLEQWWLMAGKPKSGGHIGAGILQKWCHIQVPQLISRVQNQYPTSKVVFRNIPRVSPASHKTWGGSVEIPAQDFMNACISQELNKKVDIIDYNQIMNDFIARSGTSGAYKKDGYHPSDAVSLVYMNEIFNYAESLTNTP